MKKSGSRNEASILIEAKKIPLLLGDQQEASFYDLGRQPNCDYQATYTGL